jgi:copper(I)-binding protein
VPKRIAFLRLLGGVLAGAMLAAPFASLAVAVITVSDPWVRAAPDGKSAEPSWKFAARTERRSWARESDLGAKVPMQRPGTKPAAVDRIPLPAGTIVKLAPGAYRLLLPNAQSPAEAGRSRLRST